MGEPERPQLRAVPAEPGGELERVEASGPAVYADVTSPGERKPILPAWLQSREAAREHARRAGGYAWHSARYHGLRSPVYLAVTVFWAAVGVFGLAYRWLRWWLFPVPIEVYADAIAAGHQAWHRAHAVHRQTAKVRGITSVLVLALVILAGGLGLPHVPWWAWPPVALAALLLLARFGRPAGTQIVGPARVPPEYEALTQDVVTRALNSLGIAAISRWIAEDNRIDYTSPVREDGPGWRVEANLPYGVEAIDVIERRGKFASGLRRPLGAVWPEPVSEEHPGRLEVWVGRQDVAKRKPVPWPLLKAGQADVFKPVPFLTDVRGRNVNVPLIWHNWLIGAMPRQGKTAAVRCLACGMALDPIVEPWIHELKGTGDLDPLEKVSHRFVSGIDDPQIEYAAESLHLLREEIGRRSPRLKALPPSLCPDKRVTRQIAERRSLRLWPIGCVIDECQNLFAHPKYGKQAGEDAGWVIRVGPALGIMLILATQRPDKESLPTQVSGNVSQRFCLCVAGQTENDMILGTSAYKNGVRATAFRPEVDAGLGYQKGARPAPLVGRTYYLDMAATIGVANRARVARERAGTLSGVAIGEDSSAPAREPLSDALAVFNGDPGLHWQVLADRLAQQFPDRWAGIGADSLSAQLRQLGVPSVTVSMGGQVLRGCRKEAIERAAG